jgi:2'-5' RNA ligase
MRCFIALSLPEEARAALASSATACREALEAGSIAGHRPRISWSRPEGYHLTLAFLGEIQGAAMEAAASSLDALDGIGAIGIRLAGLGGFPFGGGERRGGARPEGAPAELWRVLFARLDEEGQCAAAYRALNEALVEASRRAGLGRLNPEWRGPGGARGGAFSPHVTLARSGEGSGIPGWVADRAAVDLAGAWTIGRCALYKSELQRSGAVYTELRGVELSGS